MIPPTDCFACQWFYVPDPADLGERDQRDRCTLPDGEVLMQNLLLGAMSCPEFRRGRPHGLPSIKPKLFLPVQARSMRIHFYDRRPGKEGMPPVGYNVPAGTAWREMTKRLVIDWHLMEEGSAVALRIRNVRTGRYYTGDEEIDEPMTRDGDEMEILVEGVMP